MYYYVYDGRVVYGGLSANDRFEIFLKVCSMFWIGSLGKCIGFLLIFSMNFTLVRGCYMHTSWAKELNQSILKCIKLVKICWEKNSGTTIYWLRHQFGKPYKIMYLYLPAEKGGTVLQFSLICWPWTFFDIVFIVCFMLFCDTDGGSQHFPTNNE